MDNLKETKISIVLAIVLFILFPPIINSLMKFGSAETDNDWIGFFGSYIGGLIGAVVAVTVSRIQAKGASKDLAKQMQIQAIQVKDRIDNEIKTLKLSNRVFIDYTMDVDSLLLSNKNEDTNKILLPGDINTFIKHNPNDYLEKIKAKFIILQFYGTAECVLDMKIKMKRSSRDEGDELDYMYLTGWRKDHNVYIPVTILNPRGTNELLEIVIEYTTLLQEKLKFVSDLINKKETYLLIEDGTEHVIYERDVINEHYILPGNRLSTN